MSDRPDISYNVIESDAEGYYEDKKSRFISVIHPVCDEQEAIEFISGIKKKYYDARHNCYAMIIGPGSEFKKSSDDGEPAKTAGLPMLEVLSGAGLTNVVAVVTRYFGGTLLGTGGLIRAYQGALKDALDNARIKKVVYCADISVNIPYPDQGAVSYYLETQSILVMSTEYKEDVTYRIRVVESESEQVTKRIVDITQGRAVIRVEEKGFNPL
ncbi:MAG: YigZ family protein [Lachnospiraceae bacterium]|nr:YigZ family protein [Lachnospiraceae bacterium]